jgi:uncharacterized protein
MKPKTKRWLSGLVAALLAGLVLLNVVAFRHAFAMMHFSSGNFRTQEPENLAFAQKCKILFQGVSIPRPQAGATAQDLAPAARNLQLECTNGITLGAWYCPASKGDVLVILFHGYSSEKSSMLLQAKAFLDLGMSVLMVDFRGSGDSSESYTTIGFLEAEDVAAAVRYANAYLPHRELVLYGQSMGAAAALRAVYSYGIQPDAIIVEAVFDSLLHTVRHRFEAMGVPSFPSAELLLFWGGRQAGFNGFSHNPVDYARVVKCPILFLHGAADPRARVEEARRVFAAVPARKTMKEFPDIRHQSPLVRHPDEWKNAVSDFLTGIGNNQLTTPPAAREESPPASH